MSTLGEYPPRVPNLSLSPSCPILYMKRILIKYGGNAMQNPHLQNAVVQQIVNLKNEGWQIIVVHGGGPFIEQQLKSVGLPSKFVNGQRITSPQAMPHIEMVLKGKVNGQLISCFNHHQSQAVGLSGKDAKIVMTQPRREYTIHEDGSKTLLDLGLVGDVESINTNLIRLLLREKITPVMACIGTDENGQDYNVNADIMAGHIAGELKVDHFLLLTDIDGLRKDVNDPSSKIDKINTDEIKSLMQTAVSGGMIPKVNSCLIALETGAKSATILNGTQPDLITRKIIHNDNVGTTLFIHA